MLYQKNYKRSFLVRILSSIESAQRGGREIAIILAWSRTQDKYHFPLCFAEKKTKKLYNFFLKMLLLKMWLLYGESTPAVYVLKQVAFQSHSKGIESSIE